MGHTAEIIRGTLIFVAGIAFVCFFIYWTLKKSDDPARMLFKWVLTAGVLVYMFAVAGRMVAKEGMTAFIGIAQTLVCGLALAAIWRHSITGMAAKPFEALYTGGDTPPDPVPFYSIARAKQKKGLYQEAIDEVRKQLERFPTDVEGHMLLAEIQATDMKDLPEAEATIQQFCAQPGHNPKNIAFACYSMADWHLSIGKDPQGAQRWLERIIAVLPDTEHAVGAAQRIAHLASSELLLEGMEPRKFELKEGIRNLGLVKPSDRPKAPDADPTEQANWYVHHLEQHPLDSEAREKLAVIYADHYERLDLAEDQLEEVIQQPNQVYKSMVRALNLMADLQVRHGADYEKVRQTLERIVELDPKLAAAEMARGRISRLKLELKANEKSQAVKLGSYEQNIGLNSARKPQ